MKSKSKKEKDKHVVIGILFTSFVLALTAMNVIVVLGQGDNGAKHEASISDSSLTKELDYWYDFLGTNPTYKDGWVRVYEIESELGNKDLAVAALKNSRLNDPNDEKILSYEKHSK